MSGTRNSAELNNCLALLVVLCTVLGLPTFIGAMAVESPAATLIGMFLLASASLCGCGLMESEAESPPGDAGALPRGFSRLDRTVGLRERCPYCHDHLLSPLPRYVCEGCQATYHGDCLNENGRCTTLGCKQARQGSWHRVAA